jgi:hypothetical protein
MQIRKRGKWGKWGKWGKYSFTLIRTVSRDLMVLRHLNIL